MEGRSKERRLERAISGKSARLLVFVLLVALSGGAGAGGIPEPDLVMYGVVKNVRSNANIRLGYGALTWVFQPVGGGSPVTASTTLTNIDNQYSYVIRVPCETEAAGFPASSNVIKLVSGGLTYNRAQVIWNSNLLAFVQPSLTNTTFAAVGRGRIERVDLDVSMPIVDADGNGLPDDWERMYFSQTGIDPYDDADHDGLKNAAEFRAGTNPNDASSGLRFTEIRPEPPAGTRLKWLSAPYKAYALQRSAQAKTGYLDIMTGIEATSPVNSYLDPIAAGSGPYYYRLRLDDAFSISTAPAFSILGVRRDPLGGIRFEWLSATGKLYAVQRTANLTAGFTDLATGLVATPPTNSYHDTNATGAGPYFYRLRQE